MSQQLPKIIKKVIEILEQKDGKFQYRAYVVLRKKWFGIHYNTYWYSIESTDKYGRSYRLQENGISRFQYFRTYSSEYEACEALDNALSKYLTNLQNEINAIIVKRTKKEISS